jgi:Txe/YoeB family toxin of Txe-Axe toxin-antitoxin module
VKLVFSDHALEDYLYWQINDRKMVERINKLIQALMASPNSPTRGHPKFPQAAQPNYDVSGLMAKRAAASLSL